LKKRTVVVILLLTSYVFAGAQSSPVYLQHYIRIWGFLKYYHPAIGTGRINPDTLFVHYADQAMQVHNKTAYRQVIHQLIAELGTVPARQAISDTNKYFTRSYDLSWIDKDRYLEAGDKKLLQRLKKEGYTDSVHLYMPASFFANELSGEQALDSVRYPNVRYQLLTLARYWNTIEYLYPYKYLLRGWLPVLVKELPYFSRPMIKADFEQRLAGLVAATEDTHAGIPDWIRRLKAGMHYPPFTYRFAGDSIVVTGYLDTAACVRQDIRPGDVIIGLQHKKISQALQPFLNLVSASNYNKKKAFFTEPILSFPFRSTDPAYPITFLRNGIPIQKSLQLSLPGDKAIQDGMRRFYNNRYVNAGLTVNSFVVKTVSPGIAWVDAANLSIYYNSQDDNDRGIDSVMQLIVQHPKAIVVDLRCYSTMAVWFNKFIPALGRRVNYFASDRVHASRYPGKYQDFNIMPATQPQNLPPVYQGKLIVLVNEVTNSQAELITMILQAMGPVTAVGTQTGGADGDIINIPLPGGYSTMFTGRHIAYPDGTESELLGVKRDVKVTYTTKGIAEKRDEILEAALGLVE